MVSDHPESSNSTQLALRLCRTAFVLGGPSHLRDSDANVAMLKLSDFAPEGSELPPPDNLAPAKVFIAMTELSVILSEILSTFYTVKAIHEHSVGLEQLEISCTEFESKLETWRISHLDPLIREKLFPDPTGLSLPLISLNGF